MEIISTNIAMEKDTTHLLKHKYQEEVIVPLVAVSENIDFLFNRGRRMVITADGVSCLVEKAEEIHLMKMEEDVQNLYKMSAWAFAQRWYSYYPDMDSMTFLKIKLKKIE